MSSIDLIKELREITQMSFSQIRVALEEAGGDRAKALEILKQKGASIAEKKSGRSTGEGVIDCYLHSNKKIAAMAEILCETDFVARNPEFLQLAHDIAMHVAAMNPADENELLTQPFVRDPAITVQELIHQAVGKLGENIQLGAFVRFQI